MPNSCGYSIGMVMPLPMQFLLQCATIFSFQLLPSCVWESLGMMLDSWQNIFDNTLVLPEENITSLQLMLTSLLISGCSVHQFAIDAYITVDKWWQCSMGGVYIYTYN